MKEENLIFRIYKKDALELLSSINENSIDLIITDPPYFVLGKQSWDMQWRNVEEYLNWMSQILDEMHTVLKHNRATFIFFSQKYMFDFYYLLRKSKFNFERMLIWHHKNLAKPTNKMYLWTYDPIFYIIKGKRNSVFHPSFLKSENVDVFTIPKPQNWSKQNTRHHPAEKPVELLKVLIKANSNEGDVILDPFMGSGSTGVAALKLNRKFIGCDISSEYFEIAKERLKKYNIRRWF